MKTKASLAPVRAESDIARKLDALPEQPRELIRSIFEHPRDYVLLSLRQVARKLSVDASTLLRWLRTLGFAKYADFRVYVHERSIQQATSIEVLDRTPPQTGVSGLVHNSLECDLRNLQALRGAIDADRLLNVARHVWKARRVFILAGDMSASLGSYLEYTLSMIGMNAVHAPTPGAMVHRTRSAGASDVVLAITFGRGLSATVEALALGRQQGAWCVGISDNYLSPLVDLCQEFFITPTERASFATSYTAAMAFLNALLVVVTSLRQQNLQPLLESISQEQRTSGRFYSGPRR